MGLVSNCFPSSWWVQHLEVSYYECRGWDFHAPRLGGQLLVCCRGPPVFRMHSHDRDEHQKENHQQVSSDCGFKCAQSGSMTKIHDNIAISDIFYGLPTDCQAAKRSFC